MELLNDVALIVGYIVLITVVGFVLYRSFHGAYHALGYCTFMVRALWANDTSVYWIGLPKDFLKRWFEFTLLGPPLSIRKDYGRWSGGFTYTITEARNG